MIGSGYENSIQSNGLRDLRKPICWLGDSRDRLRRFPEAARWEAGYQLIQAGRPATDWKTMPLVGPRVTEIRVHLESEYRVFHLDMKRYRELLERRK